LALAHAEYEGNARATRFCRAPSGSLCRRFSFVIPFFTVIGAGGLMSPAPLPVPPRQGHHRLTTLLIHRATLRPSCIAGTRDGSGSGMCAYGVYPPDTMPVPSAFARPLGCPRAKISNRAQRISAGTGKPVTRECPPSMPRRPRRHLAEEAPDGVRGQQ
jgi:hypothetical protein